VTFSLESGVLLAHAAATMFLTGLIWFVQVVHYPLMGHVGRREFPGYEAAHVRGTTWVVAPPMLVEALTGLLLVWRPPVPGSVVCCWTGLGLLLVIWASTFLLQVPRHNTLTGGFEAAAHRALVRSNWLRTAAWSGRSVLVLLLLGRAVSGGWANA
jgi:hypothetical protein